MGESRQYSCVEESQEIDGYALFSRRGTYLPPLNCGVCVVISFQRIQHAKEEKVI